MPLHAAVQPSEGSARQRHVHYSRRVAVFTFTAESSAPLPPHAMYTAAHMYMSACKDCKRRR